MLIKSPFKIILDQFNGWNTSRDSDDISDGQSPDLLNVRFNGSHFRGAEGYSLTGERLSAVGSVLSQYTYKRNDGNQVMVRVRDDGSNSILEWYDLVNDEYYQLLGGLEQGATMGFTEFNTSTANNMVFCNGVDNMSVWTGATTRLTSEVSTSDTTINVSSTSQFPASGTIVYNGTEIAYTSKTATTFEVASAHSSFDTDQLIADVNTGETTPDSSFSISASITRGQVFTSSSTNKPTSVSAYFRNLTSSTRVIQASIYATDGDGVPTGDALFTSTNTISGATLTTSFSLETFTFAGTYELKKGQKYAVAFEHVSGSGTLYVGAETNASSNGKAAVLSFGTWSISEGFDTTFNLYGDIHSDGVAEAADDSTHSAITKGNILLTAKNRLWIAGQVAAPSALDYSDEGDAFTYTGGANRADSGTEDFFNIGGSITGLAEKQEEIFVFGEDGADGFSFSYPTATTKAPIFREIFRAAGQGPKSSKSVFRVNNEVYFANNSGISAIGDLEGTEKVFNKAITRAILPTLKEYDFANAACIWHDSESILLMSCKSDPDFSGNDTVIGLEFYKTKEGEDTFGITRFDWPVADWAILENADGVNELYFGSSLEQNSMKGFDTYQNDGAPRNVRYVSKRFNFGDPFMSKELPYVAVRGYIKDGTDISVKTLFNAGFLGEVPKTIESTGGYVSSSVLNSIGAFELGVNPIGSTFSEVSELKEFTVFLDLGVDLSPRDFQVVFESQTDGGTYLITHVGFDTELIEYGVTDDLTI